MSAPTTQDALPTLRWIGDVHGHLKLIDQTLLPLEVREIDCRDVETVFEAIRSLRVRGAPAIGIAAAYGVVVGAQQASKEDAGSFLAAVNRAADRLAESRPTAVNLFWAIERMRGVANSAAYASASPRDVIARLLDEAQTIHEEDRAMCRAIGKFGQELLSDGQGVLTHWQCRRIGDERLRHGAGPFFCRARSRQTFAHLR